MFSNDEKWAVTIENGWVCFPIPPMPKPTMTRGSKWTQGKYWAYVEQLQLMASSINFQLPAKYAIIYRMPMPKSWSARRMAAYDGQPHIGRPDLDNLAKATNDILCPFGLNGRRDDSYVNVVFQVKVWVYYNKAGFIIREIKLDGVDHFTKIINSIGVEDD